MIVSDLGSHWQIVLQPDHAALCRQFAERWGGGEFQPPVSLEPLAIASARHDDGWAVWERAPGHDSASGRPLNFLDIAVPVHLAFWRAATAAVSSQDPYAGVLVSLHGAGIYRGRFGMQPDLKMTFADDVRAQVDTFVQEQERAYPSFLERYQVDEPELWGNYRFLQVYDLLSLYFSGQDMAGGLTAGEPGILKPVPTGYDDAVADITVEPLGEDTCRLSPYPFRGSENTFALSRRRVEKRSWADDEAFRAALRTAGEDILRIRLVA